MPTPTCSRIRVARTPWGTFLVSDADIRSNTSVCAQGGRRTRDIAPDGVPSGVCPQEPGPRSWRKKAGTRCGHRYRVPPPGLRIWCGARSSKRCAIPHGRGSTWACDSARAIKIPVKDVLCLQSFSFADELRAPKALRHSFGRAEGRKRVRMGLKKARPMRIIGGYDGLAVRSATKADRRS